MQKRENSNSKLKRKSLLGRGFQRIFQLQTATIVLLGTFFLSGIIIVGWFTGEQRINQIFDQINTWQINSPTWLEVPSVQGEYLLIPTFILLLTVYLLMRVSPQPRVWSRRLIIGILILLTLRYAIWRSLSTLNVADPLNGIISLGLYFLELFLILHSLLQFFLLWNLSDHHREADKKSLAVIDGSFVPSIDILIPTYNEPPFILRRTIIGCQALNYANKEIYVLDDKKRLEIKELAEELGCRYIAREDNSYAKAGNLNHAIAQTTGELIVVFDADFIPTKNFLTRTVGFFQDEKVALVQTPQSFYNADPITRNLGLENVITSDEEIFYRIIQPMKDAAGSVVCAGTSFVMRRSALERVGGFVTESLSEDYFTGIRLSAQGYRLIYLNEKLSAGLAAENISTYITQRLRWARGTLQAFFIKSNPLTIPGLNLRQRLAHLEGLSNWFNSISRAYFLFMPLAYSFLGVIPIRTTLSELSYFWLPYYLVTVATYRWLNGRSRSAFLSDIYFFVMCFPLSITVFQVLLKPFATGFKVTPKGMIRKHYTYNWTLAFPLIILLIATIASLWQNICRCVVTDTLTTVKPEIAQQTTGLGLGWVWSIYNLIMIGTSLLILLDFPKADIFEWLQLRRVVKLKIGEYSFWGVTTMMSEAGVEVALTQQPPIDLITSQKVNLEIVEENLHLAGEIISNRVKDEVLTVRVRFESVSLSQHRRLVEMLFCRPGQWRLQTAPGEWRSLLLLVRILLKPRILFHQQADVSAIAVSKV